MVRYKKTVLPVIGYEYLLSHIALRMPPLARPAQVRPVTRIERMPERRRNTTELILLKPPQIERIEAIVANCFARNDGARN